MDIFEMANNIFLQNIFLIICFLIFAIIIVCINIQQKDGIIDFLNDFYNIIFANNITEGLKIKDIGKRINRLGNDIRKNAKGLKQITKGLEQITKIVNKMMKQFACLFKIFANYRICLWSFFLDFSFNLILFNIFLLFFVIFIYLPLWIGQTIFHQFLPSIVAKPNHKTPFDYFIRTKLHNDTIKTISLFFETIYTTTFGFAGKSVFLYRNKKTVANCYCYPFLRWAFLPLTTSPKNLFKFEIPLKQTAFSNSIAYFIFTSILILSMLKFWIGEKNNENNLIANDTEKIFRVGIDDINQ